MKTITLLSGGLAAMVGALLPATPAQAAPRTWVASTGSGTTCSRAAPCANFQAAHDATDAGGEINCVDAGQYDNGGSLAISKSITIDCTGIFAAINGSFLAPAVAVDVPGGIVALRGLTIEASNGGGPNDGNTGIQFGRGTLHIEHCRIAGFRHPLGPGRGIFFGPFGGVTAELYVSDSVISDNGLATSGGGIIIQAFDTSSARVAIERTLVQGNTYGIFANGMNGTGVIAAQISDSTVAGSKFDGISAFTAAGHSITSVTVDRSSSSLNAGIGIQAQGSPGFVLLDNSTVIGNGTGLSAVSGGNIYSYQNNQLTGNVTEGAPTALLTDK